MDELTEILESGIQEKRKGNYQLALDYYKKAKNVSSNDSRIYANSFRVLIGLERYDEALRNLMVIASFNRIDRLIETDLLDPLAKSLLDQFSDRFESPSALYKEGIFNDKTKYEPEFIQTAIDQDELLNDLIFRADNLTYYIGHAYIGTNTAILSTHNIPLDAFKNLNNSLLGKPTGDDLRQHKTAGLFLCVGFVFACLNFKDNLDTKEKVIDYYLDESNSLDYDLATFRSFINKQSQEENVDLATPSNDIETLLNLILIKLKNDLACECFYEYKSVDEYKTDMAMQLHLPILLVELGLKIDDILRQNYYHCTIAVEIDESDNIVSNNKSINVNDWNVERTLEEMLNTAVTSVGAINRDGKKFRTLKFITK